MYEENQSGVRKSPCLQPEPAYFLEGVRTFRARGSMFPRMEHLWIRSVIFQIALDASRESRNREECLRRRPGGDRRGEGVLSSEHCLREE